MKLITCNYCFIEIIPLYLSCSSSDILLTFNQHNHHHRKSCFLFTKIFSFIFYNIYTQKHRNQFFSENVSLVCIYMFTSPTSHISPAGCSIIIANRRAHPKNCPIHNTFVLIATFIRSMRIPTTQGQPAQSICAVPTNHFPSSFLESCCCCVRHMFCWNLWPHHNHQPHIME